MRVLFYSPDSYGLGHVRRSISVAKAVLQSRSVTSALMLTGAPRAHYFDYPSGCDYVKLPSITKNGEGRYVCRDMDLSLEKALLMRGSLIDLAADAFQPGMLLVDHSPRGLCGEILPTLSRLGERGDTFRVLGMRDVIDEPRRVKKAGERDGVIDVLRHSYDHVIVYGQRDVFSSVRWPMKASPFSLRPARPTCRS
jgi:predicted glycosyltransferase